MNDCIPTIFTRKAKRRLLQSKLSRSFAFRLMLSGILVRQNKIARRRATMRFHNQEIGPGFHRGFHSQQSADCSLPITQYLIQNPRSLLHMLAQIVHISPGGQLCKYERSIIIWLLRAAPDCCHQLISNHNVAMNFESFQSFSVPGCLLFMSASGILEEAHVWITC